MIMIIAVLALAVLLFVFYTSSRRTPSARDTTASAESTRYHAVSIRPGLNCCQAAQRSLNARFLSTEAPRLPLAGCDAATCTCRFMHHQDRRAGEDRRTPFQRSIAALPAEAGGERRVHREDRRHPPGGDHLQFG